MVALLVLFTIILFLTVDYLVAMWPMYKHELQHRKYCYHLTQHVGATAHDGGKPYRWYRRLINKNKVSK